MAALHVFPCIRGFDRVFAWLSRQLGASGLHCREGTTDSSRLAKRKIDFCNDFIDNSHFATCAAAEYPFGVSPMPTTLDIDTLRSLLAIVDTRSFSLAAERLGRSQSAVSLQISRLEGLVGHSVLARQRGRVVGPAGAGSRSRSGGGLARAPCARGASAAAAQSVPHPAPALPVARPLPGK